MSINNIKKAVQLFQDEGERNLRMWKNELEENPASALKNAEKAMFAVSMVDIGKWMQYMLETLSQDNTDSSVIIDTMRKEVASAHVNSTLEVESRATPYAVQRMAAWREAIRLLRYRILSEE